MASLLAVMYNPNDFFEPESFKPERFFENGQFQEHSIKVFIFIAIFKKTHKLWTQLIKMRQEKC